MRKPLAVIILAAAAAGGCLSKDTTHTIYLAPDGGAAWMAVETDVYSDERDPARREEEEQAYLRGVTAGDHGVARGLAALAPAGLTSRIIRDRRPYAAITEADFPSLEFAVRRLLAQLELAGEVACTRDGSVTTLTVRLDLAASEGHGDPDTPVVELFENLDRYRFVLTEGRFVGAIGFELRDGGRVAVPIEPSREQIDANEGVLELSLKWQ
jgi:hypothetical protein